MNNFSHRNPVLLVHGINDTAQFLKMVLTSSCWSVYDLDLLVMVISVLTSWQVANYVAATLQTRTTFRYSWLQHGRNCQPLLCAAIVGN